MLSILVFTCNAILPVILLILLGYLLKQKGFFTAEFLKVGNRTVFNVCLPVMLYKNIADIDQLSDIRGDVMLYAFLAIVVLITLGGFLSRSIADPRQKGVVHQCTFRSNFALIGVPLAELLGGSRGVALAAILSVLSIPIYNAMAVVVLTVYRDGKTGIDGRKLIRDICRNPLINGVLLGLLVLLLRTWGQSHGLQNPFAGVTFINTVLSYLARAATPLSLLVLGGQFEFQKAGDYRRQLTLGVLARNVLAPLIGVAPAALLTHFGFLHFGPEVFAGLIALFGTPIAVASAIMAEAMDNDGQLAAQLVVWTSLVSMLSLFVLIFLVRACGLL